MHVLITGAAGMVGRKLTDRLIADGGLNGKPIDKLTLVDVVAPKRPDGFTGAVDAYALDISSDADSGRKLVADRPDVIFHLAAVVSGEAEMDFEKGYRVNLVPFHYLLEAIRCAPGGGYHPKLVFTSSIAVFGSPFPSEIPDNFFHTPLTSYGAQKGICELLLADYSRKGFLDGVGIRLPTICVRPGTPNKAASGFFSNIIREPLAGKEAVLPVEESVMHWHASPRSAAGFLVHAAGYRPRDTRAPNQPHHAGRCLHGRGADRCAAPRRGRQRGGAHPPRAGRGDHEDRVGLADPVRCQAGACARLHGRGQLRRDHPRAYR